MIAAEGPEILWRLFPSVLRRERQRFLFFFALSGLLAFAQILGLAGSEALFLARVGPSALPATFIFASLITVLGCLVYAALVGRTRNDILYIRLLVVIALGLFVAIFALRLELPGTLHTLFSAAYLTQAVLINLHFWTFVADFFDTLQSKRLYPYFAVGASVGGVLGGTTAAIISATGTAESTLLAWAIALLICALLVRLERRNLSRWRLVGSHEKDESSVAGIEGALRFLTRSPLARWLVVSVVGMISSLFLIQYLYMETFSRAFPSAEELAAFLGIYLAASNAIEIVLGNLATPWLLRRFGVSQANLVHPVLTLMTFGLLTLDPRLWIALLARADRDLVENALAAPIRQLTYNALPFRFRGRMRALLEGVVLFGAMAMAGAVLLMMGENISRLWLCGFGAATSLLYLGASFLVRREYLRSLVTELRRGRLDLADLRIGVGNATLARLAQQWEDLLKEESEYPTPALLQLASPFARGGFSEVLLRAFRHPHPRVRRACIEALDEVHASELEELLPVAFDDEAAEVRLVALRAAGSWRGPQETLARLLEQRLHDADPSVRSEAALALGADGFPTLRALASSERPEEAIAAFERLPRALHELAIARSTDDQSQIRASALAALTRLEATENLPIDTLLISLQDADPRVREAAARALSLRDDHKVTSALADALDDPTRAVRGAAAEGLANRGAPGVAAAMTVLASPRIWTADAALNAIAASQGGNGRQRLGDTYRNCVKEAWRLRGAMELDSETSTLEARFMRLALENAYLRTLWLAFRTLDHLEDRRVVRSVRRSLRSESLRDHADALEVLSNLGEREASGQFALLLESGSFEEKLSLAADTLGIPQSMDEVLHLANRVEDRWLAMAATAMALNRSSPGVEALPTARSSFGQEAIIMERLLALRNVPIFAKLSLDRLEAIHGLMGEADYIRGESIVREGDDGDQLFVLLEGEVQAFKSYGSQDQRLLGTQTPVAYFGEIAILDNAPRSATVVASKDSRLLTLAGEPFKELVLQAPEISFEIFRVLTSRIRAAEIR